MRIRLMFALMLLGSALFSASSEAQPSPTTVQAGTDVQTAQVSQTSTSEYTLPPDKLAKSKALYDIGGRLRILGTIWGFTVLVAVLYLGVVARFRDWAERMSSNSFVQALIVVPLFLIVLNIVDWPLAAYEHSISLQYGLSVQHWGSWFGDVLKGMLVSIVILTPALWFLVWRIRRNPRWWWLESWLIALPFMMFLITIVPVVIDPLFNKFEPLDRTNPQLVDAIERVVQRGGLTIPRDRMFLMRASEKVTTLNAYVTGFGPSKRVVVWDTTIQKATIPETLFVFGHEMGHYVLNHVIIGLSAAAVGLFAGLYLLYRFSGWFLRKFQQRWHIRALGDWAALPMVFLMFSIFGFVAQPVGAEFSRMLEHNADVYGLEVTHGINPNSQEAAAHAFQVLGELSLSYPYPGKLVVFWYYDHPPISDRVRFAHEYAPWSRGEPTRYVK